MERHLHIISLDVPYPVDYGGVYDLFYKLQALQNTGIKIHLHCFEYGRGEQPALNKYCEIVHYYKRKMGLAGLSFSLPYIVNSRRSKQLISTLLRDDYPILMEGVHCTYLLRDRRFNNRKLFLRLHNVEHIYYGHLYNTSRHLLKKIYYFLEARTLLKYEKQIANKATILTVNSNDNNYYEALGSKQIHYLPLFLPPWQVKTQVEKGSYCLYHGNLSVSENDEAAKWLLKFVFSQVKIPFVIAGKNPSTDLQRLTENSSHTCLVANPGEKEMQEMIAKAQVNILPSFNATGIKLKLLNALYNGKHCLVNNQTIEGTGVEKLCVLANDPKSFQDAVTSLYDTPFTADDFEQRKKLLGCYFDNDKNAQQLSAWIFNDLEK